MKVVIVVVFINEDYSIYRHVIIIGSGNTTTITKDLFILHVILSFMNVQVC